MSNLKKMMKVIPLESIVKHTFEWNNPKQNLNVKLYLFVVLGSGPHGGARAVRPRIIR